MSRTLAGALACALLLSSPLAAQRSARVVAQDTQAASARAPDALPRRNPETPAPSIVQRVRIDSRQPIDFHAAAWPDTVYVNQQVTYQVGVFLSDAARARLRVNPEFLPPELRGLISYDLGTRPRGYRQVEGTNYDAHVFQRALFPVEPGVTVVAAPQLTYKLSSSSSYFSRETSHVVRAESAQLVVRALPEFGRPADFTGAVGRFRARGRIDTDSLSVGNPVVFTLRVEGIGNIKLLPRPVVEVPWASVVTASERLEVDSTGTMIRGAKEFDWILTPSIDGEMQLPAVRYSYFDPYSGEYVVAESDAVALVVAPGSIIDTDERENAVLLPLRESIDGETLQVRIGQLVTSLPAGVWLLLLGLAPIPAIVMMLRPTPASRDLRDVAPVQSLATLALEERSAPHAAPVELSQQARTVRRALHVALAQRLGVRVQQLTDRRQVVRLLRRRGATRETVSATVQLLDRLDHAGFALAAAPESSEHKDSFAVAAARVFGDIERETLAPGVRTHGRSRQMSVMLLLSLQSFDPTGVDRTDVSRGHLSTDSALTADFAIARDAYTSRRFVEATSRFATLAERAPDAANVLANWGTAAWAQGDTVGAVIGWHRAARRDRLSSDLQERLLLLPAGARGGVAELSLVSAAVLWASAAVAWMLGWILLFMVHRRRRQSVVQPMRSHDVLRVPAYVLLLVAFVAGSAAWWESTARNANDLFVVTRPETMRTQRGTDSDALGGVGTGDIVKRTAGDDDWFEVLHADGRAGWLPTSRLVQLDPPRAGAE